MKTIGNVAGVVVGLFLIGAVLVAQNNYQKSFGGSEQQTVSQETASIASYSAGYETVALK